MVLGGAILGVIAVFLPPLAVFIRDGCGVQLLINIGLCFLGWIPGIVHAWYVILEYPNMRQRHRIKKERRRSYSTGGVRTPVRGSYDSGVARPRSRSRSANVYAGSRQPYYRDEMYAAPARQGPNLPPPRAKY
ncbi:Plasma membrane proteolipid 3 [Fulvia fulva]|uniref:Plasma membrane proteolipid 3 n=1 Tax=Passalora fulva TaxID=5499 RepID=A0A9Q8P550_PASFU|nr:Plasma membrane proteolipid 3 [Fulvia fulva]KAK4631525.1 Plasma membrane proteolipid 3 [Fulvia fulva]KAK4633766.1 Plasma membrane proteolipid 3 [Fulvia fulva]UJO13397.1 Plasma membrane proteolipid 3 [Fulvia fulva]WPV11021.1 Plasma membrane proteolipid 3 [Fulvia fulva]WPV26878.1 Plasma membrane proteolipid 3 [Fulvia fulva]